MTLFASTGYRALPIDHPDFADLSAIESDLLLAAGGQEQLEEKLRSFFRSAIDEVIDTARTGRFFFGDLEPTEKTYLGTKFEILLRDWLQLPHGLVLDLLIGEREVDVKSTTRPGYGWMIPPEAIDRFCILLRVDEAKAKCTVGLLRARQDYLRVGVNRDQKTSVAAAGRANIWWLVSDFAYTPNFWTLIPHELRNSIMNSGKGKRRLAALFEACLGMPISRIQVQAVAAQDDYMKRLRKNGGARDILAAKGIAILYSGYDRDLMLQLGLKCGYREFMSHKPRDQRELALLRTAGKID